MLQVEQIINYLENNKGTKICYLGSYEINVYNGDSLQANISKNNLVPFMKIEQRKLNTLSFFLEEKEGIINYNNECCLKKEDNVLSIFQKFKSHPKVQEALISLLALGPGLE